MMTTVFSWLTGLNADTFWYVSSAEDEYENLCGLWETWNQSQLKFQSITRFVLSFSFPFSSPWEMHVIPFEQQLPLPSTRTAFYLFIYRCNRLDLFPSAFWYIVPPSGVISRWSVLFLPSLRKAGTAAGCRNSLRRPKGPAKHRRFFDSLML